MPAEPEHLYKCPECGAIVPETRLDPPTGVVSCDKCQLRLGRRGTNVTILAHIVTDDLPEATVKSLRNELDKDLVVSQLREKGGKAFADPTVCDAIRRTEGCANIFEVVGRRAKTLEHEKKQAIADALQAAYLLDKATLPEGARIGLRLTPTKLRAAVRWAKRQHPKFVRSSRRFLTRLNEYRESVRQFETVINSPDAIQAAMNNLERLIRSQFSSQPNLQGTSLKNFQKSPPHVLAAIQIVSILRASEVLPRAQTTHDGAIDLCIAMLQDAGLVSGKQDPDTTSKLWESVSQAIKRSTRKHPR